MRQRLSASAPRAMLACALSLAIRSASCSRAIASSQRTTARAVIASDSAPFYLYEGRRVDLEIDSTRMIVAGPTASTILSSVLSAAGIDVVSISSNSPASGHVLAQLRTGGARARLAGGTGKLALDVLRRDPRFIFVSPAYNLRGKKNTWILPLNRVVVRLRAGASPSAIDSIAARYDMTVERRPDASKGAFYFALTFTKADARRDVLAIVASIYWEPAVDWAQLDAVSSNRLLDSPSSDPLDQSGIFVNENGPGSSTK